MNRTFVVVVVLQCAFSAMFLAGAAAESPASSAPEIHCKHFIYGYPLGAPASNDLIIRDLYALSSNDQTKFADWVCYYLTPHETMGDLDLERAWRNDPWLDEKETLEGEPASEDDYRGAYKKEKYDRGHLAPLASFKGSRFASQVNYYSNITPQQGALNQGPWMRLEDKERKLVEKYGSVWVMTGALYEEQMPPLPDCDEPHTVPSGFWKIIVVKDHGVTRVAAFIMKQDTPRTSDFKNHLVTIDEVEQRSGLNFLWELPDAEEAALESVKSDPWVQTWPN